MASSKFAKIDSLNGGENIEIYFPGKGPAKVNGVSLPNPFSTTVEFIKDNSSVSTVKKEIYLEVPSHDNKHDEYVIKTENPAVGNGSVSAMQLREYHQGIPDQGDWTPHILQFDDVDI